MAAYLLALIVVALLTSWRGSLVGTEAFVVHGIGHQVLLSLRDGRRGSTAAALLSPRSKYLITTIMKGRMKGWGNTFPLSSGGGLAGSNGDYEDTGDVDVHPSVAWLNEQPCRLPNLENVMSRPTLAVDYGTKRVGLAAGLGISPRILPGLTNCGSDLEVVRKVLLRARGEDSSDVVVGLPLTRAGEECYMSHRAREFALVLADAGAVSKHVVSVYLWDERFTTAQATAMKDRHGGRVGKNVDIDSLAASLILQHYLESDGRGAEKVQSSGHRNPEILIAAGVTTEDDKSEPSIDPIISFWESDWSDSGSKNERTR